MNTLQRQDIKQVQFTWQRPSGTSSESRGQTPEHETLRSNEQSDPSITVSEQYDNRVT